MNIQGLLKKYENVPNERFFQDIVVKGEYEPAFGRKADVVIDVGALAGEFGAYMYDKAKIIYAIEPYSEHFAELTDNIEEFEMDKIKPFRLALGDFNGEGTLVISQSRGGHRLVQGQGNDKTEKVEVKTLATFMKDEGIEHVNILKIDIENGEEEVFKAPDFKDVADKIDFIIGEHAVESVPDILEKYGFSCKDRETLKGFTATR